MEVGEEPVAGGGERIFFKSRDGVTRRVFDVVPVELEFDVWEEGQGPRQTGNILVGSIPRESQPVRKGEGLIDENNEVYKL